jgi:hypothetical protein
MPINIKTKYEGPVDHLIIPDYHSKPDDNFRRFEWLGNLVLERQPKVIVSIGDGWDMASLCSYDQGKKSFVFKNVKEDIEAGHLAESLFLGKIEEYNNTRAKWKKKQYNPLLIKCIGNHEDRVSKLLSYEPRWEGTVSLEDFKTRTQLKEVVIPFKSSGLIDGILYSHYFVSGVMGRPVSSARALIMKKGHSCTMGHLHLLETHSIPKPTGEMARGLICGSFHDIENESFAGPQVDDLWWNGVIYKHGVYKGDYDCEEISVERLRDIYG